MSNCDNNNNNHNLFFTKTHGSAFLTTANAIMSDGEGAVDLAASRVEADWVVNFKGYGFKHEIMLRQIPQYIICREQSATNLSTYVKKQLRQNTIDASSRPTMDLNNEEKKVKVTQSGMHRRLWVGLYHVDEDDITNVDYHKEKVICGKGKAADATTCSEVEIDNPPLKVIAVVTPTAVNFYALVARSGNFCTPYKIKNDDCFFFAEYRDQSTTVPLRTASWATKIRLSGTEQNIVAQQLELTRKGRLTKIIDTSKPVGYQDADYINTLYLEMAALAVSKDPKRLERIERMLDIDKSEITLQPANHLLRAFVTYGLKFDQQDAHDLAKAHSIWGRVEINADMLYQVRGAMRLSEFSLDTQYARQFIITVNERMRIHSEDWNLNQAGVLQDARALVHALCPWQSRPTIADNQFNAVIAGVTMQLNNLRRMIQRRLAEVKDMYGENVTDEELVQIMHGITLSSEFAEMKLGHHLLAARGMHEMVGSFTSHIIVALDRLIEGVEGIGMEAAK
ncbi:hypothetical protein LTR17_011861 [Elasticomyces elasticus]|nr:hypothetical protein LTR17_011861 [Elasticomyces elasticus]